MSTDFDVVCDVCKVSHHLGQSGATFSFGYGRLDGTSDVFMEESVGRFIEDHFNCGETGLRIVLTDALSDACSSAGFKDVTPDRPGPMSPSNIIDGSCNIPFSLIRRSK